MRPKIVLKDERYLPTKGHPSDAGYDLKACIEETLSQRDLEDLRIFSNRVVYAGKEQRVDDVYPQLTGIKAVMLFPGERKLISTGCRIALKPQDSPVEEGLCNLTMLIVPRSGLASKYGLTVSNSPGVVDAHYRGEVKVSLYNTGAAPVCVRDGDRIAQALFVPVFSFNAFEVTDTLDETERSHDGFGSTGV